MSCLYCSDCQYAHQKFSMTLELGRGSNNGGGLCPRMPSRASIGPTSERAWKAILPLASGVAMTCEN